MTENDNFIVIRFWYSGHLRLFVAIMRRCDAAITDDDPDVAIVALLRRLTKTNNQVAGVSEGRCQCMDQGNRYTRHAYYRQFYTRPRRHSMFVGRTRWRALAVELYLTPRLLSTASSVVDAVSACHSHCSTLYSFDIFTARPHCSQCRALY